MAGPGSSSLPAVTTIGTGRLPIGATLAAAMRLWWRNRRSFAVLALVAVAPVVIATELLSRVDARDSYEVGIAIATLIMSVLGEAFCAGLAEHMVRNQQLGLPRQPWWRLMGAVPIMRLAAVSLVTGVIVLCGLILLVVPGLVAYAWLALATPLAGLERTRVLAALRGSVAMVRGHFWPVAALTTATFVPAILADMVSGGLRAAHAPLWIELAAEVATDVLVVALSAAVIVTIFAALGRGASMPIRRGSAGGKG